MMRIGLFLVLVIACFALLSHGNVYEQTLVQKNLPPSSEHWFGTDDLGRDLWARTWYGARVSLLIGTLAALIDLIVGVLWGGIAALRGGRTDALMMRGADFLTALPHLLVVILLLVILGGGILPILIAMTLTGWIPMARIVRGQLLQLKEQEYVLAARSMGASFWWILFCHLLPNAAGPILVTLTLTIPTAIFVEAFLSFMGLGIEAPLPSLGTLINDGLPALRYYPWRLFFPSGVLCLTMLGFNLLGDGLKC